MNPITSYQEFIVYMKHSYHVDKLIPVVLVKPSTISLLSRRFPLDCIFDYYDHLTGEDVIFFMPGYAHHPGLAFRQVFHNNRPVHENDIIIRIERLGNICYSNQDFVAFIDDLRREIPDFKYYGSTELLLLKYVAEVGDFDFSDIHRYDLTQIFLKSNGEWHPVENFLEMTVNFMRKANNDTELINRINNIYPR